MRQKVILFFIFPFLIQTAYSQDEKDRSDDVSFSVFVQSGVYKWAEEFGVLSATANFEKLFKTRNNGYVSLSLGGGPLLGISAYSGTAFTAYIEADKLFGGKHHFLETGAGLRLMVNDLMIGARIGYRIIAGHFIFRIAPEIIFPPVEFGGSVGLGYRFGI